MPKPEVSPEVVLEDREPSSAFALEGGRARRYTGHAIIGRIPVLGPRMQEEVKKAYQLKWGAEQGIVEVTHAMQSLMSQDARVPTARVKAIGDDTDFEVFALSRMHRDGGRRFSDVTDTMMHITSPAGHVTHLQSKVREVPSEKNAEDLVEPKVEVAVINESGQFAIEEYSFPEQQEFAQVVHKATTALIERSQLVTPVRRA